MRKTNIIFIVIIILILSSILFGCNKDIFEEIPDNVSYVEIEVYWGQSENCFIEVTRGKREIPLNANGKSQNVAEFFEVKITPTKDIDFVSCNIIVSGDKGQVEGEAKHSLIEDQYVFTSQDIVKIGVASSILIKFGESEENIELSDMIAGNIDWRAVLDIAKTEFAERLAADTSNSSREIFIKLARDRRALGGEYFWYVCYIGESNDFWSLLIDAENGNIISKK